MHSDRQLKGFHGNCETCNKDLVEEELASFHFAMIYEALFMAPPVALLSLCSEGLSVDHEDALLRMLLRYLESADDADRRAGQRMQWPHIRITVNRRVGASKPMSGGMSMTSIAMMWHRSAQGQLGDGAPQVVIQERLRQLVECARVGSIRPWHALPGGWCPIGGLAPDSDSDAEDQVERFLLGAWLRRSWVLQVPGRIHRHDATYDAILPWP